MEKFKLFFGFNYKKLILFIAVLIFIPVPFNGGLVGGTEPIILALLPILVMAVGGVGYGSLYFSLFFLGEAIILLFSGYFLACLIYKILFRINKNDESIAWLHIFIVIALLFAVFLFAYFNNIIYISA